MVANIAELRGVRDPKKRIAAALDYIREREGAIDQAREIRDDAIAELLRAAGVAQVARETGLSVSHVKLVKRIGARS